MAKKALVTGASRGIGKAISVALAARVTTLRSRRAPSARATPRRSIRNRSIGPTTGRFPAASRRPPSSSPTPGRRRSSCGWTSPTSPVSKRRCATLVERWDGADVVVNNGRHIGPGLMDTILDTPIHEYEKFLAAHGVSTIRIAQLLLPGMLERGSGTFVTISSGAGTNFYPRNPPGQAGVGLGYRIGKAAGHTIVGSILAEYASSGIRAFNVEPGFVRTERNSLDAASSGFDISFAAPPEAVGAAVAWLVSSAEADELMWGDVNAQQLALDRGLVPDWHAQSA